MKIDKLAVALVIAVIIFLVSLTICVKSCAKELDKTRFGQKVEYWLSPVDSNL